MLLVIHSFNHPPRSSESLIHHSLITTIPQLQLPLLLVQQAVLSPSPGGADAHTRSFLPIPPQIRATHIYYSPIITKAHDAV
jgi:hypothetical protein